jgi:hypothetical protein
MRRQRSNHATTEHFPLPDILFNDISTIAPRYAKSIYRVRYEQEGRGISSPEHRDRLWGPPAECGARPPHCGIGIEEFSPLEV